MCQGNITHGTQHKSPKTFQEEDGQFAGVQCGEEAPFRNSLDSYGTPLQQMLERCWEDLIPFTPRALLRADLRTAGPII
ncbi:hypothetical protein AOLI_G00081270 [Acnodon oligacanthus]